MQKTENTMFCTECGKQNSKVNSFCLNCGNELTQEKLEYKKSSTNKSATISISKPTDKIDNSSDYLNTEEMNFFISKKVEYYNEKFNQITKTGNKRTWNWASFFFNILWLLYRKMYVQFGIAFLINIVVAGCSSIPILGGLLSWAYSILFGIYGNSIYLDHINRKLNEINCMGYELKEFMIRKKGGTNIVLPLIVGFIYTIIIAIIVLPVVLAVNSFYY